MHKPVVTELITEQKHQIRGWMWRQRLERRFWPHSGLVGDGQQLHFMLGVKGSGLDHLARLIVQPGTPIRFFSNPLSRFEPQLAFSSEHDRLALDYHKQLEPDHPLLRVYRMMAEFDNDWSLQRTSNRFAPDNPESVPCLIKENHALLATEALLRQLGARMLLYIGDPVKIVDGLFDAGGSSTGYLRIESKSVLAREFLGRFLRRDYSEVIGTLRRVRRVSNTRKRSVLRKVVVVALLQHMFRILAARYPKQAILVRHDRLAQDPFLLESLLEGLFGECGLTIGRAVTAASTFIPDGVRGSVWKNAWPEQNPVVHFLTSREVELCRSVLQDSGLDSLSGESDHSGLREAVGS